MFIGSAMRLSKNFTLFIGQHVGSTKREKKFDQFVKNSKNAMSEISTQIYKKIGLDKEVYLYAMNCDEGIDLANYLNQENCELIPNLMNSLNTAMNLLQQAEFTDDISLAGKEKITRLIFEAQDLVNKLTNEPTITADLLEFLAKQEHKSTDEMLKAIKNKDTDVNQAKYKKILVLVIISLALFYAVLFLIYK
nr:hypothetical protein [uncultured Campylobacter sp.]